MPTYNDNLHVLELELIPFLHNDIPSRPLVLMGAATGSPYVLVLHLAQGQQVVVVGAERVYLDNGMITMLDVGEELGAEGEDGLGPLVLLAGELVNPVGGEQGPELLLVLVVFVVRRCGVGEVVEFGQEVADGRGDGVWEGVW